MNFALPGEWVVTAREESYKSEQFWEAFSDCDKRSSDANRLGAKKFDTLARQSREAHVYFYAAADCLVRMGGDFEGATSECREWLHLEPNNAQAHECLAKILGRTFEPEGALFEFVEAIRLEPKSAQYHLDFAEFLKSQGDANRASFEEAQGHYCVGRVREDDGRLEDALSEYKKAYELDPLGPNILSAIDRLARKLNRAASN